MAENSAGLVPLQKGTIEFDFKLLEHYQKFSAELLRIALIGITAIGYAISQMLFAADKTGALGVKLTPCSKTLTIIALIALAVSAGAALWHRYASADSMACHLAAIRLLERSRTPGNDEQGDVYAARIEAKDRKKQFGRSIFTLKVAASALATGAFFLVAAIIVIVT